MKAVKSMAIDLGARSSRVAAAGYAGCRLLRDPTAAPDGELISAVYIDDGLCQVGSNAHQLSLAEEGVQTMDGFNRMLGRDEPIAEADGVKWYASMATAMVIRRLCQIYQTNNGRSPDRAVVSVPEWFDKSGRSDVLFAAGMAGLRLAATLNSAEMAARYYQHVTTTLPESLVIIDAGEGPATASAFVLQDNEYRTTHRCFDHELSGRAFRSTLAQKIYPVAFKRTANQDRGSRLHPKACNEIAIAAMRSLSSNTPGDYYEILVEGARLANIALSSRFLTELIRPLVEKLSRLAFESCSQGGISIGPKVGIMMLGGLCSFPLVREQLCETLGVRDFDPDGQKYRHAVVLGSALTAFEASEDMFTELTDQDIRVPSDVRLQVKEGSKYEDRLVLFGRDERLPIRSRTFTYTSGGKKQYMEFRLAQSVQGGSVRTLLENKLGPFDTYGAPRRIDLRAEYSISGGLDLKMSEPVSGRSESWSCQEAVRQNRVRAARRLEVERLTVM